MKRMLAIAGIGTAVSAAAIVGGLGVAFAHDDGHESHQMMGSGAMQMMNDPAAMEQHMREIVGDQAYTSMRDAMNATLGPGGYEQMLDRMAAGCADSALGMMTTPGATAPGTGHSGHHTATN